MVGESDLFRAIMGNTIDRIYFKDRGSRFLRINRALAEHLGLADPADAVGKTDFDFFVEAHARQAYADEQNILVTGRPLVGVEKKEIWSDGREAWVSTSKIPIRNREGKIIGTFGISRDITDQKVFEQSLVEANRALEESVASLRAEMAERLRTDKELVREHDLFRMLMDNTTDRIYFKDRESRFVLVNRATSDFLGLTDPSQAAGKTDFDFFSEEHARQAFKDEQTIVATGGPLVGIEEKETWPDGHETWVSSTKLPFRDREGKIVGTFGISRDITDHKLGEEVRIRAAALREANVELEKINTALQAEIAERKRVEGVLAYERDLFRAMMDNTSDRIYFKDRDSRFLMINQALATHFGITDPLDAVGKRDFDYFSEEHARMAFNDEQRIVSSELPFVEKEEKETWPDGHTTWVSTMKFPLRDQDGVIIGTFGISRDITERKSIELSITQANEELEKANAALQAEIAGRQRVEEELDKERNLLHQLIDNLPDNIFAKDADGRFTMGNIALARHMGVDKPEDIYGKTDFDFYPPDLAKQFSADERALIESDQRIIEHEESTRDPAGRPMVTLTTKVILFDSQGRRIGLVGIAHDITGRKNMELAVQRTNEELEKANEALQAEIVDRLRAEEALARESNLFRTLMDSTSDRICFKDEESRFLMVNQKLADAFRLKNPSEANGKTDFDFFSKEYAGKAFEAERRIMDSGNPMLDVEETEVWPDGRETWVSASIFPMRDHEGKVIGTFGISREITERKSMESAIQLANDKLAMMVNWLEGRNRDIRVLNEMGNRLEACRSPEEAYPAIAEQMEKLIPVATGKLFLFDANLRRLTAVARWGTDPEGADSFPPEGCRGFQSGQPYMIDAVPSGDYCEHMNVTPGQEPVSICLPLISRGETTGILHLRGKREDGAGGLPDLKQQMAAMAADHITLTLANLTLRETLRLQSIHDALTGLYNRRYLEESLVHELARTKRREAELGVIMVDVDRLKHVNDTFGHEAGDAMLQVLSNWLQSSVRRGDISCRFGGDEFVVILPDASLEDTIVRAHQICEGVAALKVEHQGRTLGRISVSVGVAGFPMHGETRDQLLEAVDAALYKAKEQGRDCVVVAGH